MYSFLNKITPDHFEAICALAQMEMLEAGYGGLTEFHYVHNDIKGSRFSKMGEMSERVLSAASVSGIGLTLLPVLYEHGGVSGSPLISGQDRFGLNYDEFCELFDEVNSSPKHSPDAA